MLSTKKKFPFNCPDGVEFTLLIKSNITLKNGKETVMFTIMPKGLSFDDVIAGIDKGLEFGYSAKRVQHETFSLLNGECEEFARSTPRDF